MPWKVIDNTTGRVVEEWNTPRLAYRAMMILSAHEVKAGRVANFRVEPMEVVRPPTIHELNLPKWVLDVLEVE